MKGRCNCETGYELNYDGATCEAKVFVDIIESLSLIVIVMIVFASIVVLSILGCTIAVICCVVKVNKK